MNTKHDTVKYYALRHDGSPLTFSVASTSMARLEENIEKSYWMWKGMQKKGNNLTKEDFFKNKRRVLVEIQTI